MIETCPICNADLVQPVGDSNSEILLVGSRPGEIELKELEAFAGWTGKK